MASPRGATAPNKLKSSFKVKKSKNEDGDKEGDEGGDECGKEGGDEMRVVNNIHHHLLSQSQQVLIFCSKVQMRHFVVEKSTSSLIFSSST